MQDLGRRIPTREEPQQVPLPNDRVAGERNQGRLRGLFGRRFNCIRVGRYGVRITLGWRLPKIISIHGGPILTVVGWGRKAQ